jgi:hypothetical protein
MSSYVSKCLLTAGLFLVVMYMRFTDVFSYCVLVCVVYLCN